MAGLFEKAFLKALNEETFSDMTQKGTAPVSPEEVDELLESSYSSDIRTFSLIIAAYVELQGGNLSKALNIAHKAKAILACKGHVFLESYADLIVALCDRYMGRGIDASIIFLPFILRRILKKEVYLG